MMLQTHRVLAIQPVLKKLVLFFLLLEPLFFVLCFHLGFALRPCKLDFFKLDCVLLRELFRASLLFNHRNAAVQPSLLFL